MPPLAVHARFTAETGRGDELRDAVADMYDAVRDETGTLVYAVHADRDDPDAVIMYELYADDDALERHGASEAAAALGDRLGALLSREPEVWFSRPVAAKGLGHGVDPLP